MDNDLMRAYVKNFAERQADHEDARLRRIADAFLPDGWGPSDARAPEGSVSRGGCSHSGLLVSPSGRIYCDIDYPHSARDGRML
jgi:hypothetical protein